MLKLVLSAAVLRIVGALATLLLSVIVARTHSVEQASVFFLTLSFLMQFRVVSIFGMAQVALKLTAKYADRDAKSSIVSIASKTLMVSAVTVCASCFLIVLMSQSISTAVWGSSSDSGLVTMAALIGVPFALTFVLAHILQGTGQELISVTVQSLLVPFFTALGIYLLGTSVADESMRVLALSNWTVLALSIYWFSRKVEFVRFNAKTDWSEIFRPSLSFWLIATLAVGSQHGVQLISSVWLSVEEISVLAVSIQLKSVVALILVSVNLILAPRISANYHSGRNAQLRSVVKKGVVFTTLISLPILFFSFFFGDVGLAVLYGEGYSKGFTALKILVVGEFVNAACGPVGYLLTMTDHEKYLRKTTVFSITVSIVLVFLLTPIFGIIGVASAITISAILHNLIATYFVFSKLGFIPLMIWRY